jgi:7,8-dihydroneopterin aldolase/epimerase/oxygenase
LLPLSACQPRLLSRAPAAQTTDHRPQATSLASSHSSAQSSLQGEGVAGHNAFVYLVYIEGLEFYAYHGVSAAEREIGHRYVVSLEFEVDGRADASDKVEDTVDYAAAAIAVQEIATKGNHLTLERLARLLGDHLLNRFRLAQSVRVRLGKRLPPAPILADEVGVEIEVTRAAAR